MQKKSTFNSKQYFLFLFEWCCVDISTWYNAVFFTVYLYWRFLSISSTRIDPCLFESVLVHVLPGAKLVSFLCSVLDESHWKISFSSQHNIPGDHTGLVQWDLQIISQTYSSDWRAFCKEKVPKGVSICGTHCANWNQLVLQKLIYRNFVWQ